MPLIDRPIARVKRHRAKMREAGLRPVQFWVHDTRKPEFTAMLKMQCQSLKDDKLETVTLDFTQQAVSTIEGWE